MDLIFFGMQGAGKGTLGKAVAQRYQMQIFETGAELRRLAQEDSPLAHKVKSIIESGRLVPTEVVMEIVEDFLANIPHNTPVLFDGIPRSIDQANSLNKLLHTHGRSYRAVLIEISKETALHRLSTRRICSITKKVYPADYPGEISEAGGTLITRTDDNPEAIKNRLNAYEQETLPTIELYRDTMITLNGEPSIQEVEKEAFEKLDPLL